MFAEKQETVSSLISCSTPFFIHYGTVLTGRRFWLIKYFTHGGLWCQHQALIWFSSKGDNLYLDSGNYVIIWVVWVDVIGSICKWPSPFLSSKCKRNQIILCILVETISGEGNGTPLQYSCLENPMDGGAWWAAVHEVAKSRIRLSDFTFTFHFYALEKEMATHSSVFAWRIPGTGEPDGLPSKGSHRVGHDWSDLAAAAAETISGTKRISTFSNGWMVKLNPRT